MTTTATLNVAGVNCASCVGHVSEAARGVPGVAGVAVNLAAGRARVHFDADRTDAAAVAAAITEAGYTAEPALPAGAARRGGQYGRTTRSPGMAAKCFTFCVNTSTPSRRAVAAI